MENKNPESLPSANTNEKFEEQCWGDENNFENPDPNNVSTTDIKDKDSGHQNRSVVKQICRFYLSQNYCRYGRNCRFSHDRSSYGDNRNSERKYSNISLSGDLKTTRDSKHSNTRRPIKKENETEVNQVEKSTGRIDRKFHGTSSSMNKYSDKQESAVRQEFDVSGDLPYAYAKVETPRQSSVMGRQRNLVFYRSNKETASNSHASRTQASNHCRYFLKGFCRLGDKCRFVHQESNGRNAVEKTETKHADKSSATDQKKTNEIYNSEDPRGHGVPVMRRFVKLQDLDTNEIMRLRNTEIQQLKKRFPAHEIIKSSPEEIFHVTVSPSDPDWSFAVNSVPLEVTFTAGYPREACTIKVLEANNLPPILVRHLNNCVNDWIKEKHEFCLASGKVELLFRPFLRWLDRNLEELFIVGLRKVKQDLIAREAGIEFVPYDELPGATSVVPVEINDTEPTEHPNKNRPDDGLISSEEFNELDFGDKEQHADSNDVKHVQKEGEEETPVCNTFQEKEMTLISELQADYSSSSAGKENFFLDVNNLKFTSNDSLLVPANSCSEKFSVPKVGTEIKLVSLELTESAAAMVCTKIAVTLQCSRCKTRHEINTPPKRNNSLNCIKCHHLMQIVFQPAILHQFSTVMGYLHLVDCQAVDIPLMECSFNVDCLNCSKQISVSGIHYGQQRVTWCLFCNKKISVYTQSVKFHQLQPAPNIASTGHKLTTATRKEKKVIKDPAIQEGKPLPDCGTCRHYKKSYRWLRFPCCGKAYPCDYCHDEKETDHEMKYANRMICGFCAKEQPYAGNKPCIICSSNMTKKAGSHWEGGKGCRDKITMSREDRQKYAGIGKTVSRKAQIQKPKKK